MQRFLHILFWSVISAAFIGPGTVTTAAKSGAQFGLALLWALLFSTAACLLLQEAAARVTVISGIDLGRALRQRFREGTSGLLVLLLVLGAIVLGCAAYQAGNILGSVAGAALGTGLPPKLLTVCIGVIAAALLYFGTTTLVARVLGLIVAVMGVTFLVTALLVKPPLAALLHGLIVPTFPRGSGLLVLGLIGTTVVPYNLFLGSGIAAGQKISEIRFGLSIAVLLGGIISMGVLVVGSSIAGEFSFETLSAALTSNLGGWSGLFFAIGLFSAGFSSAVTAPLAAAITARGLFSAGDGTRWTEGDWRYRAVWAGVLLTGVLFGLMNVKPIPAIILAQALNGVLLPFVAIFLFIVVNDITLMGREGINNGALNIAMLLVIAVTILLGASNVTRAVNTAFALPLPEGKSVVLISVLVIAVIALPLWRAVRKR